jgi:hypothetical protein
MKCARTAATASLASRWLGTAAVVSLKGKRHGVKGERRGDCSAIGRWVSAHTKVSDLVGRGSKLTKRALMSQFVFS